MTCRHGPGDPNCGSHPDNILRQARAQVERERADLKAKTPDAENYEVLDVVEVGPHLVMKAQYPNCIKCSYEGTKVMVFLNCKPLDVIKWRKIDPHFREPSKLENKKEAPGPNARFPASTEGWADAMAYARGKQPPPTQR